MGRDRRCEGRSEGHPSVLWKWRLLIAFNHRGRVTHEEAPRDELTARRKVLVREIANHQLLGGRDLARRWWHDIDMDNNICHLCYSQTQKDVNNEIISRAANRQNISSPKYPRKICFNSKQFCSRTRWQGHRLTFNLNISLHIWWDFADLVWPVCMLSGRT